MNSLDQLEAYTIELAAAVKTLANHCRNFGTSVDSTAKSPLVPPSLVPPDAPSEAHCARQSVLACLSKLRTLLSEPADFLQQLATQVRIAPPQPNTKLTSDVAEPAPSLPALAG